MPEIEVPKVHVPTHHRERKSLYSSKRCRIWARVDTDLCLRSADEIPHAGRIPGWLGEAEGSIDTTLASALGLDENGEEPEVKWLEENGLAPNQLFLVEIGPPCTSGGGSWYNDDYDYWWDDVEVIDRSSWTMLKKLQRWAHWLRQGETISAVNEARSKAEKEEAWRRTDKLYVWINWHGHIGTKESEYEGWIYTSLNGCRSLLSSNRYKTADLCVEELAHEAAKMYPHISPKIIRKLPRTVR